jgi:hypothetical protein
MAFMSAGVRVRINGSSGWGGNHDFSVITVAQSDAYAYGVYTGNTGDMDLAPLLPPWSGGGASINIDANTTYALWSGGEIIGEVIKIETPWGNITATITGVTPSVTYDVVYTGNWAAHSYGRAYMFQTTSYEVDPEQIPLHVDIPASVVYLNAPITHRHIIVNYT